ncbi:histidine kinase N-terminal 7TM domain-containing protein [uncultured Methanoregula sp.]|uniref:histidine kinase N-terminal 7TM domain-containing protein n=1 Tax=uncultured Methanoregula sp. TaxID=1005933 RepID=UPI002AAB4FFD|nr:histidine kinase N-terminal 7TM domain-containing protein [uncultured Methanoregula sp.]
MAWQYSPLALILAIAAALLALFTFFAWKRRRTPGIIPVFVLFLAAMIWLAASAISLTSTDLATTLSMNLLAYPAVVTIPVAYLVFALWYTERDYRPSRLFLALLFVIPVLSVCLVATNDLHTLFYSGYSSIGGPRNSLIWVFLRGPLYWITASYSLVLVLSALLLFAIRYRTVGTLFRTQIELVLAAGLVPFLASLIYYLDLGPEAGFDWTPVTFVVSGFLLIAAMLNFELFSLQPMTHSFLVKTMKDGVVATNAHGFITLINPAGSALLGVTEDQGVGRQLTGFVPELARFITTTTTPGPRGNEITLPVGDSSRIFEVQSVAIPPEGEHDGGYILLFRDVTERKNAETAFQKANRKLNLLSGIVRHDVKNKLTALFLYVELAMEGHKEKDGKGELARIRESAEEIRTLIDFTQEYQDLGVAAPSWQSVGNALAGAGSQLDCSGIQLVDETGGLELLTDRLFQRVVYNLLDNAIRYARGMTTFSFRYTLEGGTLILYAEDDGPGVPPEDKERIFERGFGHNTGLGLFLVRDILGITDITIRETGELQKGARFEMTVPPGAFRFP